MRKFPILFFLLLLGSATSAPGQVYESTDEEGNVTFSDQPTPESKEVTIPATNVGDSVEVPPPAPEPEPAPEIVAEEPAPPEGQIFVKEKDDGGRWRPRPSPHRRGGGRDR